MKQRKTSTPKQLAVVAQYCNRIYSSSVQKKDYKLPNIQQNISKINRVIKILEKLKFHIILMRKISLRIWSIIISPLFQNIRAYFCIWHIKLLLWLIFWNGVSISEVNSTWKLNQLNCNLYPFMMSWNWGYWYYCQLNDHENIWC